MNEAMMQKVNEFEKELIRVKFNINQVATEGPLAFDVLYDEMEGWVVQTSYYQMGGCLAGFIPVKDKDSGILIAATMTYFGEKPTYDGLCSSCRIERITTH